MTALSGWQDISTAPKDGDDILVYGPSLGMLVVSWDENEDDGFSWLTLDGPNYLSSAFTHWMPLPALPETEGR